MVQGSLQQALVGKSVRSTQICRRNNLLLREYLHTNTT